MLFCFCSYEQEHQSKSHRDLNYYPDCFYAWQKWLNVCAIKQLQNVYLFVPHELHTPYLCIPHLCHTKPALRKHILSLTITEWDSYLILNVINSPLLFYYSLQSFAASMVWWSLPFTKQNLVVVFPVRQTSCRSVSPCLSVQNRACYVQVMC